MAVPFYCADSCKAEKSCYDAATVAPEIHSRANAPVHPCNIHVVEAADINSLIPRKHDRLDGRSTSPAVGTTDQHFTPPGLAWTVASSLLRSGVHGLRCYKSYGGFVRLDAYMLTSLGWPAAALVKFAPARLLLTSFLTISSIESQSSYGSEVI